MPDQQQQKNNNIMCKKNAFTILTRKKNQSQVIRQSIMFLMLKILNIRYIQSRIHGNYVDLNIPFSVIHAS